MPVPLVRLAPLDLIRGFVAVGRRMSITLAAQDLCLTQSALSRQVRALEDWLGFVLFQRGYRSISFTPEGERLFRTADAAVQQLQEVFEVLGHAQEGLPVTITASIGVTGLWLLPRINGFQRRYPECRPAHGGDRQKRRLARRRDRSRHPLLHGHERARGRRTPLRRGCRARRASFARARAARRGRRARASRAARIRGAAQAALALVRSARCNGPRPRAAEEDAALQPI